MFIRLTTPSQVRHKKHFSLHRVTYEQRKQHGSKAWNGNLQQNTDETGVVQVEAVLLHVFLSLSLSPRSKTIEVPQDSFHSTPTATTTPRPQLHWALLQPPAFLSKTQVMKHQLLSTDNAPQLTHKPPQSIMWPSRARHCHWQ